MLKKEEMVEYKITNTNILYLWILFSFLPSSILKG